MMGAYFVATGISQYAASKVANLAAIPEGITDPLESLSIYTHLFNNLGFLAVRRHGRRVCAAAAHEEALGDATARRTRSSIRRPAACAR